MPNKARKILMDYAEILRERVIKDEAVKVDYKRAVDGEYEVI